MGAGTSVLAIDGRIDITLPHHTYELAESSTFSERLVPNTTPVFPGGHNDRAQFVHSLRVLLSSNGQVPLGDKRFRLVFTRAPQEFQEADDSNPQIYASMVATSSDGILAAKIVSERAGRDKVEAFQMFRKTVEMHMHRMLDNVPGPGEHAGPSRTQIVDNERNMSATTIASTVLPDEPPTYQEASK